MISYWFYLCRVYQVINSDIIREWSIELESWSGLELLFNEQDSGTFGAYKCVLKSLNYLEFTQYFSVLVESG